MKYTLSNIKLTQKIIATVPLKPPCPATLLKATGTDTLTVWKLDRLGRSVRDVVNILHDLTSRGIQFQSLTEQIDTTHPLGKAMLHMVALLAELGAA